MCRRWGVKVVVVVGRRELRMARERDVNALDGAIVIDDIHSRRVRMWKEELGMQMEIAHAW